MCPCHSNRFYEDCCKRCHCGSPAENALTLMRSRYSAYAIKNISYILATTHCDHPDKKIPPQELRRKIKDFCKNTFFQGLQIISFEECDTVAFVTFKAILTQKGADASFTERSRFEKFGHQWFYHSAEFRS